jgi:hypothetical protein
VIKPNSLSEQLLFSTVRIETNLGVGTGFFFNFSVSETRHIPVVVTNKHVIESASLGQFYVHEAVSSNGETIPSGNSFSLQFDQFSTHWIQHPDNEVDLCAMLFGPIEAEAKNIGKSIYRKAFDETLIWSDQKLDELRAVEEILMIGYPIGLFDEVNNLPIVRRGITATHPAIDFKGKSRSVIDAACFPGSSGSPVLIVNEGMYSNKNGTTFRNRAILLGVLFEGPTLNAAGEIVIEDIPTSSKVNTITSVMIHLGYIVKAKELISLGNFLKEKFG